jgi:3-hydroxyacyl-CoA dehydrogenase/enoyl-CoA hydratase/3-hydroxybutyryl-CoA epimerase
MSRFKDLPVLREFRVEEGSQGIIHLVFDMPQRSMNVFANAAIHELGRFADWLGDAEVRGVVVRSGKQSAFCVGADLAEIGTAYEMITAAPAADRFQLAFDHFFPLSRAIRALETSGKPVAAAIGGLALGGGCELALGAHHRVLADHSEAALGLPESLVGVLPGGGGTQRLPRLIGIDAALPVLLNGDRLAGQQALSVGLVDEVVAEGEEVEAAERWILTRGTSRQPWDRPNWRIPDEGEVGRRISSARTAVLQETLGHYPAPLAILDCIEQGLRLPMDEALQREMSIFSRLIQRPEPRNMIRALFLGRLDHERAKKAPDPAVEAALQDLRAAKADDPQTREALAAAGFRTGETAAPVQREVGPTYWIDAPPLDPRKLAVRMHIDRLSKVAGGHQLSEEQQRSVDYRLAMEGAYPAYLPSLFSKRI